MSNSAQIAASHTNKHFPNEHFQWFASHSKHGIITPQRSTVSLHRKETARRCTKLYEAKLQEIARRHRIAYVQRPTQQRKSRCKPYEQVLSTNTICSLPATVKQVGRKVTVTICGSLLKHRVSNATPRFEFLNKLHISNFKFDTKRRSNSWIRFEVTAVQRVHTTKPRGDDNLKYTKVARSYLQPSPQFSALPRLKSTLRI